MILGSGLGSLTDMIEDPVVIPYAELDGFPQSTVAGHSGNLVFGKLQGRDVVVVQGRFHYYEGYSMQEVVIPVRVMHLLGVKNLIVTNASGGVNENFSIGDTMIITDHINLMPDNPLRGPNIDELGPRFPDMSEPYDRSLIKRLEEIVEEQGLSGVQKGVYTALSGPTYETLAEYRMARIIGSDTVGMSTVPEVIAAVHMGMTCTGLSVITDLGVEGLIEEITHEMVMQAATKAAPVMSTLIIELIKSL